MTIGLRRANLSPNTRLAIRRAIKTFFFEGLSSPHALEQIAKNNDDNCPEVEMFINFIKQSNRGIMPGNPKYTGVNDDVRDALESGATAPRG